jgi:hypothetical protein
MGIGNGNPDPGRLPPRKGYRAVGDKQKFERSRGLRRRPLPYNFSFTLRKGNRRNCHYYTEQ